MDSGDDQRSESEAKEIAGRKSVVKYVPLPEKQFVVRNSVLTDLFDDVPDIKTIRHIFVAILICLGLSTVAHDYFIKREVHFGVTLIFTGFGKFHIVLFCWMILMILNCLSFASFGFWAKTRINLLPKARIIKLWDITWLVTYIVFQICYFMLAKYFVNTFRFPPPSACTVLLEQIRFSMKLHSFIRTSAGPILWYKPHTESDLPLPNFSEYFYFLFAPTIIFRTNYPRTSCIRWKFIFCSTLEILGVIVCQSFIFHRIFIPAYEDFGRRRFTWDELIVSFLEHALPGLLIYVSDFYLILHSMQNIFAELLRFGDRLFHRDWWNCRTFTEFFRNWNVIVHDWLYTYIYKDIYEHVVRSKGVAKFTTFLVSAIVHEWAFTHMFGYFFPLVFIFFMLFVMMIMFIKIRDETVVNILFWIQLALGCGFLVSGYTLEFFARQNIPGDTDSLKDLLFPRWLTCVDCIH
ncbi:sterol O-acyltransferase 1-like [Leptinotarsa decemlineata]|uniref:sterol O-acyltransferase 1-like n=1 Tax=Leptinotarsa decemlineata TaxID=7539 RepID=UPI003D308AD6